MKKKILISVEPQETRAAILDGNTLEEFFVERKGCERLVGQVFKGKVNTVIRGMGAAFLDLGIEKNGFLYVTDIITPQDELDDDLNGDDQPHKKKKYGKDRERLPKIDEILKRQQEIMVQIVKEPIGTKGPRLTTQISLPGRFLVLMPHASHRGVSKRIENDKERQRLKGILEEVVKEQDCGFIIRTASEGRSKRDLSRDAKYLLQEWKRIKALYSKKKAPAVIHTENTLPIRVVRDYFTDDVGILLVDDKREYKLINQYVNSLAPQMKGRIQLHKKPMSLFAHEGIEKQIAQLYERKVDLPCGGHVVIEHTEGMTAIDVNSGKFTGKKNLEQTAFTVNKEAAIEIARQLRLRDIGGIIITDFIDMEERAHRKAVFTTFEQALVADKAKTNILSVSEIGVVEMTRQRLRKDIRTVAYEECPHCRGRGMVKSSLTVSIEARRAIEHQALNQGKKRWGRKIQLRAHPEVIKLIQEDKKAVFALRRRLHINLELIADAEYHIEDINVQTG